MIIEKTLTIKNILIIALILVIIFLVTCHRKAPVVPVITPVSVQKEVVRVDSIASRKYSDSVTTIIARLEEEAKIDDKNIQELMDANTDLQLNIDAYITQPLPDTCQQYQHGIIALNKKLNQSIADQQKAYSETLTNRSRQIAQRDILIQQGKKDFSKLKLSLDTCWQQQTTLTKALKQLSPKRSIGLGVTSEAGWIKPIKFDMGAFIYYRGKNGNQFSVGAMTSQRIQLSYSKTLFKL
jgi:hypothetical protein